MARDLQAVRGMNDILPDQSPVWQLIEDAARAALAAYDYEEIRLPLVERTELFSRAIGEVTDIVEKEMYTFADRNGDSLTLRPEGTAGCVRAGLEHGLLRSPRRLWYAGPMFRHERPQKGRYRQFYQIGVEAYGFPGPDVDAEQILLTSRLWQRLGVDHLTLELNSLGSREARRAYRATLVDYLSGRRDVLDEDSLRRLETNPLRVLDSKNPDLREVIDGAPSILEHLDEASRDHLDGLRGVLEDNGVAYRLNPRLVRGLDYYERTVFEWTTDRLGAQGTVCAGGRYDGLVEQLGGPATPAVGFALGLERLVALLDGTGGGAPPRTPHVYLLTVGEAASRAGHRLAETLRDRVPRLRLRLGCGGGSFKAQMKRADRSGARIALILGDQELASGQVGLKDLRGSDPQEEVPWDAAAAALTRRLPDLAAAGGDDARVGDEQRGR